jgi:hypothetical protein
MPFLRTISVVSSTPKLLIYHCSTFARAQVDEELPQKRFISLSPAVSAFSIRNRS